MPLPFHYFGLLQADPRVAENGVGGWLKFAQNVITSLLKVFWLKYNIERLLTSSQIKLYWFKIGSSPLKKNEKILL